jgi:hypothetical protein
MGESVALLRKLDPELTEGEDPSLAALADELGDLPLALHLAPLDSRWLTSCSTLPRRAGAAPHLVALVRAGATFVDGLLIEREDQQYAA